MIGLSDSERISMIRSAVLIQYTRVTDGRTDRRNWRGIYTRYSIYAVARKNLASVGLGNNISQCTELVMVPKSYGTDLVPKSYF